jgi:DNA-directed RNA polymerase subunit K/omega
VIVIDKTSQPNSFELVVIAGARARQLLKGARPRVESESPLVRVAQAEVAAGKIQKIDAAPGDK